MAKNDRETEATIRRLKAEASVRYARHKLGVLEPDPYLKNKEYNFVRWRGQRIPIHQTWKGKRV